MSSSTVRSHRTDNGDIAPPLFSWRGLTSVPDMEKAGDKSCQLAELFIEYYLHLP
jgi:hypothetical protein